MKKIDTALAQQIAESVKEVCGHDINFIDDKGTIFASTDKSRIKDFHEAGFLSSKNGENIIVTKSDTPLGSLQGINIPVFYKGSFIAVIGISGEPQTVQKYADLAVRITKLFLREREVFDYNRTKQEKMNSIVNALITNDLCNRSVLQATLTEMKIKETDPLYVILFRVNQNSQSDIAHNEQFLFQLFHRMDFTLYTYHYPDEYIVIAKEETLSLQINLLREFTKQHKMILVGLGDCKPMYQLMQSYETAQLALNSTKHLDCNFCEFNQLDIEILLSSLDKKTIYNYTNKTVLSLSKKDQQLLSVYYSENMSLQRTSNRLYIHKNTIQYRLDKIARLTGYNPRSFRDALVLYLGILLSD